MNKKEERILAGALQQQAVHMGGVVGGEYASLCKRVGGTRWRRASERLPCLEAQENCIQEALKECEGAAKAIKPKQPLKVNKAKYFYNLSGGEAAG